MTSFYMTVLIRLLCAILQQSVDKCTHAVCMVPLTAITAAKAAKISTLKVSRVA